MVDNVHPAVVVGSGPAGLAGAAALARRGVPGVVLERGAAIGAAWAGRYDSLRRHSALPGAPFPRVWGQFPCRDLYVT